MARYSSLRAYRQDLQTALKDQFLGQTLARFAANFRTAQARAFEGQDYDALVGDIGQVKADALNDLDALFEEFKRHAEAAGAHVHLAETAQQANEIIEDIAREGKVRNIVKSKSMTSEETFLNPYLEARGYRVTETDLGEWIIQLKGERPSHMTVPAIHLSRHQIAGLFSGVVGRTLDPNDVKGLVEVARGQLRRAFLEADMGITGANIALAGTGTLALLANEGNIRLVTTLPRIHVALLGLEKLVPDLDAAISILKVLPKNVGGQALSSYVTWITGANSCLVAPDGRKELHIVFLDNGRRLLAKHPVLSEALRCVRCGACASVCPIYGVLGGHRYGHVYVGAIGLILTYYYHGAENARYLIENCLNCQACRAICSSNIDLPGIIKEVERRVRVADSGSAGRQPVAGGRTGGAYPARRTGRALSREPVLARVIRDRRLFHRALRLAARAQGPLTGGQPLVRHLPSFFEHEHGFRSLPAIASTPFRDQWSELRPRAREPRYRVAIFGGCLMDFVYPEMGRALLEVLREAPVELHYPMGQSCCGLPVGMMAEPELAAEVARQNIAAFGDRAYSFIVTLCASCASFLKGYSKLLRGSTQEEAAGAFADRVIDVSSFLVDVLGYQPKEGQGKGASVAYHAPCHLCRGLGVEKPPRALLRAAGYDYVPLEDENVCCGFGGHYSVDFPEVSAALLKRKLDRVEEAKVDLLATDCPGCVLQLRGGADKRGAQVAVGHIIELLAGGPGRRDA